MRDLLECAWPAVLDAARQPFRSVTWIASLWVIASPDGADLARTRRQEAEYMVLFYGVTRTRYLAER
jgi:hypothetical protein